VLFGELTRIMNHLMGIGTHALDSVYIQCLHVCVCVYIYMYVCVGV